MFFKKKLTWKRPLFYALLPVFLVMIFLGFPIPVAPPPATKAQQEESAPIRKKNPLPGRLVIGEEDHRAATDHDAADPDAGDRPA